MSEDTTPAADGAATNSPDNPANTQPPAAPAASDAQAATTPVPGPEPAQPVQPVSAVVPPAAATTPPAPQAVEPPESPAENPANQPVQADGGSSGKKSSKLKWVLLAVIALAIAIPAIIFGALFMLNPSDRVEEANDIAKMSDVVHISGIVEQCYTDNAGLTENCDSMSELVDGGYLSTPSDNVTVTATSDGISSYAELLSDSKECTGSGAHKYAVRALHDTETSIVCADMPPMQM